MTPDKHIGDDIMFDNINITCAFFACFLSVLLSLPATKMKGTKTLAQKVGKFFTGFWLGTIPAWGFSFILIYMAVTYRIDGLLFDAISLFFCRTLWWINYEEENKK